MTLPASLQMQQTRISDLISQRGPPFFPKPICQPTPESGKTTQKTGKSLCLFFSSFLDGCHLCDCLVHANLISLRFTYTAEAPHYVRGVILELRFINQNSNYCIITNPSLSHLTQSI